VWLVKRVVMFENFAWLERVVANHFITKMPIIEVLVLMACR